MDASSRPILLIGAGGQLGRRLASLLPRLGPVVALTRADVDLEHDGRLRDAVRRHAPRLVVNTAAYTSVDAAESDAERCERVNAVAPAILAEEAARCDAPFVDFSTNYVFDGMLERPYVEDDVLAPLNVYGRTKALGERRIAGANPRHLIFRTNGVYEWTGKNFLRKILDLAHERDEVRVVGDQFTSPTPAASLAAAVVRVLERVQQPGWSDAAFGIYHLTTSGAASWHEFAARALALDPDGGRQRSSALHRVTSGEYPAAAIRPRNGVLDTGKFEARFGFSLPDWASELARTIAERDRP